MSLIIEKGLEVKERLSVDKTLGSKNFKYVTVITLEWRRIDSVFVPEQVKQYRDRVEIVYDKDEECITIVCKDDQQNIVVDLLTKKLNISDDEETKDCKEELLEEFNEYLEEIEELIIDQILSKLPEGLINPLSPETMKCVEKETEDFKNAMRAQWEEEYNNTVLRAAKEIISFTRVQQVQF
nr:hypothetical protein [Moritella viscosa]SHO14707.1 UDP-N-acetylmuramoylalanyl-D-glutamate--2, 6-diaminopimelate ligase [Moritella viscosa]